MSLDKSLAALRELDRRIYHGALCEKLGSAEEARSTRVPDSSAGRGVEGLGENVGACAVSVCASVG